MGVGSVGTEMELELGDPLGPHHAGGEMQSSSGRVEGYIQTATLPALCDWH